jgi:hypothetical protein
VTSDDDSDTSRGTSEPAKASFFPDVVAALQATAVEQRRAALVVASNATGPADAHELLDMLGLLDPARLRREMTTVTPPGCPTVPTEARRPLVDTKAAAEALGTPEHTLHRFADAGIITPARGGSARSRSWNLHDLRRELAAYLAVHDEDQPR